MLWKMDWTNVPICFQSIPDPLFAIPVHGDELPVVQFPEEYLHRGLQERNIRIYIPLGFFLKPGNMKAIPAGYMIERALAEGLISSDSTLVEPTSGGMGVALAYFAKGQYIRVIAIVSDSLPRGKLLPLVRHGAQVLKESEVVHMLGLETSPGDVELARIYAEKMDAVFLNQYGNPWNPESYKALIAKPLWEGIGGHASMFISPIGSRGIFKGLGEALREFNKDIELIGVEPYHMQNIDGMRTQFRQRTTTHDLGTLEPFSIEHIDEAAADKYADQLNKLGIPAGRSAGAGFGSLEHVLLDRIADETIDGMRGPDGSIRIILPFHDTRYPYDPV